MKMDIPYSNITCDPYSNFLSPLHTYHLCYFQRKNTTITLSPHPLKLK